MTSPVEVEQQGVFVSGFLHQAREVVAVPSGRGRVARAVTAVVERELGVVVGVEVLVARDVLRLHVLPGIGFRDECGVAVLFAGTPLELGDEDVRVVVLELCLRALVELRVGEIGEARVHCRRHVLRAEVSGVQ